MGTDTAQKSTPEPRPSWLDRHRKAVVITLVVLAAIIALVSTLTVWVRNQALDQQAWTDASSELLANPAVREELSTYLANELFENVNVEQGIAQRLPSQLQPLAVPLAASLRGSAPKFINDVLARPRVQELWTKANAVAHQELMNAINGNPDSLLAENGGDVVIDLRPLTRQLRSDLGLPPPRFERPRLANITVMTADQLNTVRTSVKVIKALSVLLWLLVFALAGLAIYLARGFRAKSVMWLGLALVAVGIVVLVARKLGGNVLVDALVANTQSKTAAFAAWNIGTSLVRDQAWGMIMYGLLFAIGAWLVGASRWATTLRGWLRPALSHHVGIVLAVTAVLAILMILLLPVGEGRRLIGYVILIGLLLVGVYALRRFVINEETGGDGGAPPPATT